MLNRKLSKKKSLFFFLITKVAFYLALRMRTFNFRGRFTAVAKGMASAWALEGLSARTIARRLRLAPSTVSRYLSLGQYHETPRPPRPRGQSNHSSAQVQRRRIVKRLALRLSADRPGSRMYPSTRAIARQCHVEGVRVSVSTVRRDLMALGFVLRCRQRAVAFHDGDADVRLQFARTCKETDVLFSDEKLFDTNDHGCRTEWCYQGQRASVREFARWAPRLHIWGLIGIGVKKLVVLPEGSITKDKYKTLSAARCGTYYGGPTRRRANPCVHARWRTGAHSQHECGIPQ